MGLASMFYKFFDKISASFAWSETLATRDKSAAGSVIKKETMSNKDLWRFLKLHKPVNRKFKKKESILIFYRYLGTDLADTQLISQFNKGFRFSLCVIDIFSKFAWVIPLKDKKKYYNC